MPMKCYQRTVSNRRARHSNTEAPQESFSEVLVRTQKSVPEQLLFSGVRLACIMEWRMAPRSQWNGYLRLALVSCPISLYPAVSAAEKISFRQVNRETGHRLRQQLVDAVTGEVVESHNKGRGYEVGESEFLLVQDDELAAARQEARERPFSAAPDRSPQAQPAREQPRQPSAPIKPREEERDQAPPIVPTAAPPRPIIENTRTIELDRFVR